MVHLYKNYIFHKKKKKRRIHANDSSFFFRLVVVVVLRVLFFHGMHSNDKKCVYCVPVSHIPCVHSDGGYAK